MSDQGTVGLPRLAIVGCVHGALNQIYDDVRRMCDERGWDTVDAVIMGGDFQAIRNSFDATCISVPAKYKKVGDFHDYYSGQRVAPFLTIFCGGNHEASNYLFELYYGGWIAYNIFYLGAAGVVRLGPIRIAGLSGIWKGYDYRKPHYERLPYNHDELHSAHHVRELDVRKLLQIRTQVDIGLSHDWPRGIENFGDFDSLFRKKRGFREDSLHGRLGNVAAREVLDRLRPAYWFSAHLHVFFTATMPHADVPSNNITTSWDEPAGWPVQRGPSPPAASPGKGKAGDGQLSAWSSPPNKVSPTNLTSDVANRQDTKNSPPVHAPLAERISSPMNASQNTETQQKLAAWNSFPAQAQRAQQEAMEQFRQRYLNKQNEPQQPRAPIELSSGWKPVKFTKDGKRLLGAEVVDEITVGVDAEETIQNEDAKETIQNEDAKETVQNEDEVSLGSISSSGSPSERAVKRVATDGSWDPPVTNAPQNHRPDLASIRNRLPGSLARPNASSKRSPMPVPAEIHNKVTKFVALDKFANRDPYVQLMEITPVSAQDDVVYQRPYRLQYDPEWLAITRVFVEDLTLGDPAARVPADLGEEEYRPLIIESEKWVEENIVKRGLLDIPHNFNRTAPRYDPKVPITTEEMPSEYNNIQTAEFCELLGIPNKFYLTDEERAGRMAAGPRPTAQGALPRRQRGGRRNARGKHTTATTTEGW